MEFLEALIKVSEKAANIARVIRQEEHLFELLVQQKDASEANPRFLDDFKTLADVLIQEMVRHDIGSKFPGIKERIRGEESNVFCNKLGETITVEIKNDVEHTSELLEIVLNGDKKAANILAEEVHKTISLDDINTISCSESFSVNVDNLGVWIDPIDSTAEYINAVDRKQDDISVSGLHCVTILIGAYDLETGEPVIGVINQPFLTVNESRWRGECFWGVCTNSTKISSLTIPRTRTNTACLSSTEDEEIKQKLKEKNYSLIEAAGAGYKILTVIKGHADCYVLTKNSTFKWDTCGPQAILRALGGDIVTYNELVKKNIVSLVYPGDTGSGTNNNCNEGGLFTFVDPEILNDFLEF
ncbi:hypothetical protein HHI36_017816 [Cryptolaemus montrouzieri]|uniref:Inositol polyphosphate 1-phosphatase n=1 Tax=Cryptolaemus montrouzieri TaxID=559131 RepID=A0ABD2NNQ5_9CUCU